MPSVAVVGAGLAGLVVARRLREVADVVVFEKSRGPGGRMATRYAGDFAFDHGTQFFTAHTPEFRDFLRPLIAAGVVKNWTARFAELDRGRVTQARTWDDDHPHYVGTPGMNRIGKFLADDVDVRYEQSVAGVDRETGHWTLRDADSRELGRFDWVVLAIPAAQTAALAVDHADLVTLCADRRMLGCFALMLGMPDSLDLPWDAMLVRNADISWMSVNSSKPDRGERSTLVVHSTNAWADAHLEDDPDAVRRYLVDEASRISGVRLDAASHCGLHRWRFANIGKQPGPSFFIDTRRRLAACGDWFVRGRIEAAFKSGARLAAALREQVPGRARR